MTTFLTVFLLAAGFAFNWYGVKTGTDLYFIVSGLSFSVSFVLIGIGSVKRELKRMSRELDDIRKSNQILATTFEKLYQVKK